MKQRWKKSKKNNIIVPYIELNQSTWLKDSHGLYDYEAIESKCERETHNIAKSVKIYRHVTTLRTQIVDDDQNREMPIESIYVGTILINRDTQTFKVQSATVTGMKPNPLIREEHPDLFNNTYLVIKDYKSDDGHEGYPLAPGNVIRLGRVQYVVLEIRNNAGTQTFKQTSYLQLNKGNHTADRPLEGACKICLREESTTDDPLINPCLCKGSCEFIHVDCLRMWINSKVKKELGEIVLSYNFSKFECEICKAPFPKTVTMSNGQVIEMITVDKPNKPYLILESVGGKEDKKERHLHMVFSNDGNPLKVGRGHQCQMRVNDISVSRVHAEIRFENNKFYVKDLKSKFGTLIKFKEQFSIKDKIKLQYGRVCMELALKTEIPKLEEETKEDEEFGFMAKFR